jgi:hypothetical protein
MSKKWNWKSNENRMRRDEQKAIERKVDSSSRWQTANNKHIRVPSYMPKHRFSSQGKHATGGQRGEGLKLQADCWMEKGQGMILHLLG